MKNILLETLKSDDTFETMNENQRRAFYGIFIIQFVIYVAILILCIYNTIRFIIPKKMTAPQILGFYILSFTIFLAVIVELIYYFFNGADEYIRDHKNIDMDTGMISSTFSDGLVEAIFVLMTLTMYYLYLGLYQINHQQTYLTSDSHKKKKVALTLYWIATSIIFINMITEMTLGENPTYMKYVTFSQICSESLFFIAYIYVIFLVKQQLKLFEHLRAEKRQIQL